MSSVKTPTTFRVVSKVDLPWRRDRSEKQMTGFAEGADVIYKTKRIKVNGATLDRVLKDTTVKDSSDDDEDGKTEEDQGPEEEAKRESSKVPREAHQNTPT